jgi:hypothetical protein
MAACIRPLAFAVPQNLSGGETPGSPEARQQDPNAAVIVGADERMGAYLIFNADKLQVRARLPVQRHVKVARKDLPLRPVIKFNNVAIGMPANVHGLSAWRSRFNCFR